MIRYKRSQNSKTSNRDSIRVSLALVFILFASIASRDHESPEKTLEAQEIAQVETQVQAQNQIRRLRERETKRAPKIPDTAILSHINGSI